MLGWSISIVTKENYTPKTKQLNELASWETGLYGADWIRNLVDTGRAQVVRYNGGYPNVYQLKAHEFLEILPKLNLGAPATGPVVIGIDPGEEYIKPRDWSHVSEVNKKALDMLPKDTDLIVEIWDLS
jgi:hypothetical protein